MVSLIDHFEYIVVDSEAEALILECNLIKKNRPKFNVLLKDDKTYPYIKINIIQYNLIKPIISITISVLMVNVFVFLKLVGSDFVPIKR